MNIELARTFLEVVSSGSLARAADQLNVTHSTVTMRMNVLEEILGRAVLKRNRSGATLTPAGMRFHRFAEALVRTWQMTQRQMSLASGFDGVLSIGAETTLWDDYMFEWVCKTRRGRPKIAVRAESGTSEQLLERLFQGWLDVCIVFEAKSRTDFTVEHLFNDPLIVVSTEDRKKTHWDPHYIEIQWNNDVTEQELYYWPRTGEVPHLSAPTTELGIRFVMEFGGSILIPRRSFLHRTFPRPLYEIPDLRMIQQAVYMVYSKDALDERVPGMSVRQVRQALLSHFEGRPEIWNDDAS